MNGKAAIFQELGKLFVREKEEGWLATHSSTLGYQTDPPYCRLVRPSVFRHSLEKSEILLFSKSKPVLMLCENWRTIGISKL